MTPPGGLSIPPFPAKPREPDGYRQPARPPPGSTVENSYPNSLKESFNLFGCSVTDDAEVVKKAMTEKILLLHPDKKRNTDYSQVESAKGIEMLIACVDARTKILKWLKSKHCKPMKLRQSDLKKRMRDHHSYLEERRKIFTAYSKTYEEWRKHILSLPFYTNADMTTVLHEELTPIRKQLADLKRAKEKQTIECNLRGARIKKLESELKAFHDGMEPIRKKYEFRLKGVQVEPAVLIHQLCSSTFQVEEEKEEAVSKIRQLQEELQTLRNQFKISQEVNTNLQTQLLTLTQQENGVKPPSHHPSKPCTICGKSFSHLKRHLLEIHNRNVMENFPCKYCGYNFTRLANTIRHKTEASKSRRNPNNVVQDGNGVQMEKQTSSSAPTRRSKGKKLFQCGYCCLMLTSRSNVTRHEKQACKSNPNVTRKVEQPCACSYCGYVIGSRRNAIRHEKQSCKHNPNSVRNRNRVQPRVDSSASSI